MMNHSRIIEDMDAEGPTTPPPGSRTTILVSSLARCPCDLPERRVRAHAPFGTEPRAHRRKTRSHGGSRFREGTLVEYLSTISTLGHLLRGAFATSRPVVVESSTFLVQPVGSSRPLRASWDLSGPSKQAPGCLKFGITMAAIRFEDLSPCGETQDAAQPDEADLPQVGGGFARPSLETS